MPIVNSYIDKFYVRNLTKNTIALGDLVNLSIPPMAEVDLLSVPRITKEKINQSQSLQSAIKNRFLRIRSTQLPSTTAKKAIIASEEKVEEYVDENIGSGSSPGSGTGTLSGLTDVDLTGATNSSTLIYNSLSGKWVPSDFPGGTIVRVLGLTSAVVLTNCITWTISRDGDDKISSITNGDKTYTFTRNIDGQIVSWTVT
jgi:hypothetical protein